MIKSEQDRESEIARLTGLIKGLEAENQRLSKDLKQRPGSSFHHKARNLIRTLPDLLGPNRNFRAACFRQIIYPDIMGTFRGGVICIFFWRQNKNGNHSRSAKIYHNLKAPSVALETLTACTWDIRRYSGNGEIR